MADRYFCPDPASEGLVTLHGDEAHHLTRVRRQSVGEVVEIFDGRGHSWRAEIESSKKDRVDLRILEALPTGPRLPCELTLATALPKGERVDWLVEKATELGVARLVPLLTARTVVDPRPAKLDRLRRRVIEAAKQCGRDQLMEIGEPIAWSTLVGLPGPPLRLVAHPGGIAATRWPRAQPGQPATLAIGPEGGFSDDEIALARSEEWTIVSLGPNLLRIETAGLVGSNLLMAFAEVGSD